MRKLHRAWLVCIGCALLLFCTSGLTINAFDGYKAVSLIHFVCGFAAWTVLLSHSASPHSS